MYCCDCLLEFGSTILPYTQHYIIIGSCQCDVVNLFSVHKTKLTMHCIELFIVRILHRLRLITVYIYLLTNVFSFSYKFYFISTL